MHVGIAGGKKFTDATLPAGGGPVTYKIVAVRSTAIGVANEFIVNFGVGGGGQMTASVEPVGPTSPKMAA